MKSEKLLAILAALLITLAAASARAHVTLEAPEAKVGASLKAVFKVPHGCDGAPTTGIRIDIPEGVIAVKPMPKPGWTLAIEKGKYAKAYAFIHGMTMSEGVKSVAWTGGSLPDEFYDEFVMSVFVAAELAPDTTIYFPVTQTCEKGEVKWSETPAAGQSPHDLKSPAPPLLLKAAEPEAHHH